MIKCRHDLCHAFVAKINARQIQYFKEVVLDQHPLKFASRLFGEAIPVEVFAGAQIKIDYALICTHTIKNIAEADRRDFVRRKIEHDERAVVAHYLHEMPDTFVAQIIFGQIKDRNLVHINILRERLRNRRSKMHIAHQAFTIEGDLIQSIPESNELLWQHLYRQIIAFRLIEPAYFTFGENGLFVIYELFDDYVAYLFGLLRYGGFLVLEVLEHLVQLVAFDVALLVQSVIVVLEAIGPEAGRISGQFGGDGWICLRAHR